MFLLPLFLSSFSILDSFSLPCANIARGCYRYTDDLLALASASASSPQLTCPHYRSPVRMDALAPFLEAHPDQAFAAYTSEGFRTGFRIDFRHGFAQLKSRKRNHPSCRSNPSVVEEKLRVELAAGRLYGPVPTHLLSGVHVSPMGLVPKPHQENKFRMIVDLSTPAQKSVNDGIPSDLCSLKYSSVDDAVAKIQVLGKGTMLVKSDLKDAYRIVPVHPDDYHLLGIAWDECVYVDRALPFGLCSAPKIFSVVADFIAWVLHQQGIPHQLHYLDDFLFLGAQSSPEAANALDIFSRTLHALGIPIAVHKTEGPTTSLTFLGIVIDTLTFELRLPDDKLSRLQGQLQSWVKKSSCRRNELESLLGHLSHAATVVRPGRNFLRQLFPLLSQARDDHHYIHLTAGARADLLWWKVFLQAWNGRSFFPQRSPSIVVTSDASGTFGCGAFAPGHGWFLLKWPESWDAANIAAKELVPLVIAASLWGPLWARKCVRFRSDNMAVVEVVHSRTSHNPLLLHLLRCLVFYAAWYCFDFVAQHLPGVHNTAADALSRNNLTLFSSLYPQISRCPIPQPVVDLLVEVQPNWGSHAWTTLFWNSLNKEFPRPPLQSTSQAEANMLGSAASSHAHHSHSQSNQCVSSQQ